MDLSNRIAYLAIPGIILIGLCIALAGSQGGSQVSGIPVFAICVGLTFIIQWVMFTFSYLNQTEKYYDLTGSLTYISMTLLAVLLSQHVDARSILLLVLIMIWAGRLGSFLFLRIKKAGKDGRFDTLKTSFVRFLTAWTTQGLWVTFTSAAAWTAITTTTRKPLGVFTIFGLLIWVFGFSFEVIADTQKSRFRVDPGNQGKFIQSGLWSLSRHPNYFGEIVLWIGVAIITLPVLRGWQWVTLISPVFVTILLTRISGIPLLEKRSDEKWGGQADYEAYKERTPVLIPKLPRK
jgi:steroid 5-alpha reductase family enzyme